MRYIKSIKCYDIDLGLPESKRWDKVIRADLKVAQKLVKEAQEDLKVDSPLGSFLGGITSAAVGLAYKAMGGRYQDEIRAWADALGISSRQMTSLNCLYELSHLSNTVLGCTAGVKWIEGQGMTHIRTMDWPLKAIGPATRLFHFFEGDRSFYTVGVTGFVGALSGMVPGGYSVTINWAPPEEMPGRGFGPMFLLREVLETCDTYQEAVEMLRDTPLSTSVFYVVCGVKKGEGCVIERTRTEAVVRRLGTKKVLAQANHYQSSAFKGINEFCPQGDEEEMGLLESSEERQACMEKHLTKDKKGNLVLSEEPVLNEDTHQKMIFCPASGAVQIWASTR